MESTAAPLYDGSGSNDALSDDHAANDIESAPVPPDDDVAGPSAAAENGHVGSPDDDAELEGDDLFGDDTEASPADEAVKRRQLDDEELDSGDDEGREDRVRDGEDEGDGDEDEAGEAQLNIMDAEFGRHAIPEPSDNELYLLKVPRFLSIDPNAFHHKSFQPPTTDHHSKGDPSATFSAYNTALTTLRWRHSPSNPAELQSNARILRWSDGSLTLQFAADPTTQYEIDGNPLAPPQRNPKKPTPTSIQDKRGRAANAGTNSLDQESFTYLAAPYESASVLRVTNKITTGLSILPSADTTDDALERLQNSLAAAAKAKSLNAEGGIAIKNVAEDPEKAKKAAELAEKEKTRERRKREAHENRERDRANQALGRRGLRTGGGLTVGGLEDDEGPARTRVSRPKPRRQRRDEYDSDEDFRKGRTREDEYDEEDEFIAKSDEEEMVEDDDEEDIDDGIVEKPVQRDGTPKRSQPTEADGGEDEDVAASAPRGKRRRVVEEDDEDEE